MAPTIEDLPEEVLVRMLRYLRSNVRPHGMNHFLAALAVCRRWSNVGREILYTDVALTAFQITKFVRTYPHGHVLTRTLSINTAYIDHSMEHGKGRFGPFQASEQTDTVAFISLIPQVLQGMKNLESLSLVLALHNPMELSRELSLAMQRTIPRMIRCMPRWVKHLEIDAAGYRDGCRTRYDRPVEHFCSCLARLLPSLENLRLRMPGLCGELFRRKTISRSTILPAEAVFLINATNYKLDGSTHTAERSAYHLGPLLQHDRIQDLIEKAALAATNGRLRNTHRVSIFAMKSRATAAPPIRQRCFSAINELTLNPTLQTLRSPYVEAGGILDGTLRAFLRHRCPSGSQSEACGGWRDLMNLVEGEIRIQTVEGYRIPKAYTKCRGRFETCQMNTTTLMTQEEIRQQVKARFLHDERKHGRELLLAEEAFGVTERSFVERGLTTKEWALLWSGSQQDLTDDSDYDGPKYSGVTIRTPSRLLYSR